MLSLGLLLLVESSCAPEKVSSINLSPAGPAAAKWADKTLSRMTLEEKVGQMIGGQYNGRFFNRDSKTIQDLVDLVVNKKIGCLIAFAGEVYETAHLANFLQEKARIPLLVAADFEWGAAMRIDGTTLFPPFMALGAADSEDLAYEMGRITAVEGRAMGIHMAYAPVVDVNINPDNPVISARSLGERPESVGRLAAAFIRGLQKNGMIATAKHFPGHGDTAVDSHNLMPAINADISRLEQVELYPFTEAIKAGVEAVMTAHLYVPALDPTPGLPATLSSPILTDLLRKKMGFKGLIVTDAMTMGGVTTAFSAEEAALKAVQAGIDMILLPADLPGVIDALVRAVKDGEIPESRIDASARRILELKARLGLPQNRFVDVNLLPQLIASRQHIEQAARTFEKSVTLVKNERNVLPLSPEIPADKVAILALSSDNDDYFAGQTFVRELRKRKPGLSAFYADANTGQEFIQEAKAKALGADLIVLALFSSLRSGKGSVDLLPRHVDLIRELSWAKKKTLVVSFGSPYFLRHFPEVDGYLCLYRNTAQAQEVAARAVCGEIDIEGRLPVSIPGLYPVGHGLIIKNK
jgi:beta-N-acetylhexosaminidase